MNWCRLRVPGLGFQEVQLFTSSWPARHRHVLFQPAQAATMVRAHQHWLAGLRHDVPHRATVEAWPFEFLAQFGLGRIWYSLLRFVCSFEEHCHVCLNLLSLPNRFISGHHQVIIPVMWLPCSKLCSLDLPPQSLLAA